MTTSENRELLRRFPMLNAIRWNRNRQVPFVHQATQSDCAAACLEMTLAYHGRAIDAETLRRAVGAGRDGSRAIDVVAAARAQGLNARGVRVDEVARIADLPVGSLLHWRFHHYVVFAGVDRQGRFEVLDPARGRLHLSASEVSEAFTGIAIVCEPGMDTIAGGRKETGFALFLRPLLAQRAILAKVLAASLSLQLLALAMPVAIGMIVETVVPRSDIGLLYIIAAAALAFTGFRALSFLLREHLLVYLRVRLDSLMTLNFVEHMAALPYAFFERRGHGDLMMRMESNSLLREMFTTSTLSALLDGSLVFLYLLLLFVGDWRLGSIALLLALARVAIFLISKDRIRELNATLIQARSNAKGHQVQLLRGMETLKASGVEDRAVHAYAVAFSEELNALVAQTRLDAATKTAFDLITFLAPLIFLLYGASLVIAGDLSLGALLALSAVAAGFWLPLSQLVQSAVDIQRAYGYLDRIQDVMVMRREQEGEEVVPAPVLSGRLDVEGLAFRYNERAPWVLEDIDLQVRAGQWLAVVGASGSGKSTLAALIAGLYRPSAGSIRFDGLDAREIELRSLRRQLGVVTQSPHLFGGTIRSNISLDDSTISESEIVRAARIAGIHEEIRALPLGYDTPLSEQGGSLSGGQKQRIALARALVSKPRILILDEATSALDTITEAEIQRHLQHLAITRITIAHRLSSIRQADQIVVMSAGRIVETGTHAELLALGGIYRAMIEANGDDR